VEDKRSQVEVEPTAAVEGTGKGTGTGGTGIGLGTTAAVAAGDSGGIGVGDPTWAAVSCNAEADAEAVVDTPPCCSTSLLLLYAVFLFYGPSLQYSGDEQEAEGFALCRSQRRE
jgi:hypothetical protein